jgi:hypothetical protein
MDAGGGGGQARYLPLPEFFKKFKIQEKENIPKVNTKGPLTYFLAPSRL